MNWKALLPAAALLALLMPSEALSRNYQNYNDGGFNGNAPAGTLTPFSNAGGAYLNGGVNQFANNGFDRDADDQYNAYASNGNPYNAGGYANGYNLANNGFNNNSSQWQHRRHQCNSLQSQQDRRLGYHANLGNLTNPYANGSYNNGNNLYANNPYANPYANNYNNAGNLGNPYANGYYNNAGNLNNFGGAQNSSGLSNLSNYALNGNLNGGSLSGLRSLLGI